MLHSDIMRDLSARFPAAEVKTRSQGGKALHYIDIAATIKRFNKVIPSYSFDLGLIDHYAIEGETTRSGKQQYRAVVSGVITTTHYDLGHDVDPMSVTRWGVGSAVSDDVDMALKSAEAEAFKKAGHQYGVGLYLWDERERNLVDYVTSGEFKMAVQTLATIEGVTELTAETIAANFDVAPEHLQDEGTLRHILAGAGLL